MRLPVPLMPRPAVQPMPDDVRAAEAAPLAWKGDVEIARRPPRAATRRPPWGAPRRRIERPDVVPRPAVPTARIRSTRLTLAAVIVASATAAPAAPIIAPATAPVLRDGARRLSAAAFDAYARGKTLYYAIDGQAYGAEEYLPDHRVVWAFSGQDCQFGRWYTDAKGHICFVYPGSAKGPQCWDFYLGPDGVVARYTGDAGGSPLVEVAQSSAPLTCQGQVGV